MRSVVVSVVVGMLGVGLAAGPAWAQAQVPPDPVGPPATSEVDQVRAELDALRAEFERLRQSYDERLLALEQRLRQLDAGPAVIEPPALTARLPASTTDDAPGSDASQAQVPALQPNTLNPNISVIGNFLGAAGTNEFSEEPPLALEEVETAFQAIVDPYARADFYLAAGPDGLDVEEGFITFTALPANLLLKVGKMRAQFGKVNTLHTHAMPTVDRPLVTENLVGGEEGLSDSGLSISHLIPNSTVFLELTGEVFAGTSEVFDSPERSRLTYLGRVRGYRDLTESVNLDVGTSFVYGPTTVGEQLFENAETPPVLSKQLYGVDATLRYRPLRRAIYRRFNLRSELMWSRQEFAPGVYDTAFGLYGLGEYQFAQRWYVGGRFDRSGRALEPDQIDTGGSFFVTFWPTEFSQVRGQYRRINFAEGIAANEFLFQFNFAIGTHGAHAF